MRKIPHPLAGQRVLVTRPTGREESLRLGLKALGAAVIHVPTIRIAPPRSWKPFDRALLRPGGWDWVLFTSAYGVEAFFARARRLKVKGRGRIGVVGPRTADAVRRHGAAVAATAAEHRSEGLAAALGDVRGLNILLSVAEKSRPELPRLLRRGGARVTLATAYRTLPVPGAKARLRSLCERQAADVVVFTSPSTAENLAALAGRRGFRRLFEKAKAASIGPVTSDALRKLGVEPAVQADPYTAEGLVKALERWAEERSRSRRIR